MAPSVTLWICPFSRRAGRSWLEQVPLTRKGNTFYSSARLSSTVRHPLEDGGDDFYGQCNALIILTWTGKPRCLQSVASSSRRSSPCANGCGAGRRPLLDLCCLLGLLWLLCETDSKPSVVRFMARKMRLCENEASAEQQLRERQWIEARKNELIQRAILTPVGYKRPPSAVNDPAVTK